MRASGGRRQALRHGAVMLVCGGVLAACGGGSGGSSAASTPSTAADGPAQATTAPPPAPPDATGGLYAIKAGNQWVYRTTVGATTGTETFVMTKVTPGSGSTDVEFTIMSLFNVPGSKTTTAVATYRFNDDGSVVVPPQTAATVA